MVIIKNQEQIEKLKIGGQILATVLRSVMEKVKPGVGTEELDNFAEELIRQKGGEPSFKGYGHGKNKFPSTLCISLNDEIVHGPATPNRLIKNGDMVSLDIGLKYLDLYTDMATTVAVGKISKEAKDLINVTKKSLDLAIKEVKAGVLLSTVSLAIQNYVEAHGFNVIRDLVGHGVGLAVHEEPQIYNYFDPRQKPLILQSGMVLAIEPMVVAGSWKIKTLADGWTAVTVDHSLSAHFEHTLVVTNEGAEVLTQL